MKSSKKPSSHQLYTFFEPELLKAMLLKIKLEGFVPKSMLESEFGPAATTQGLAIMYRDFRMVREVRRPYQDNGEAVLGYEWADRRFSSSETKKIPPEWGFLLDLANAGIRPKYGDFLEIRLLCRWTNYVLGAIPSNDDGGPINVFRRDDEGLLIIPAYCLRAMAKKALPLLGKEAAVAYRIMFETIKLPATTPLKILSDGSVDEGRHVGLGIKRSEAVFPGTEFEIRADVPTTALSVSEYLQLIRKAGRKVRLSPARSSGYGDFEIIKESNE